MLICLSISSLSAQDGKPKLSEIELKAKSIGERVLSIDQILSPEAPEGYHFELIGTAYPQLVAIDGSVTAPFTDKEVQLYYKLVRDSDGESTDMPTQTVVVKGKYDNTEGLCTAPNVIPALQEWIGGYGLYNNIGSTITVDPKHFSQLKETAKLLASDISFFNNREYEICKGEDGPQSSIFVTLDCDDNSLGDDGYILTIDQNIRLEANSAKGIFLGTRTIVQLINIYGDNIPKGVARDYPKYKRRGFMLDVARKFFKIEYLRDYIKILSYYKMNEFHIHLNDNGFKQFYGNDWNKTYAAFRLESETYPGLTAKDGSYSKEEFRELQKLGMKYGVNVIPEIDIPAHTLAFTQYRPSLASKDYGMDHIDINKKETYTFFDDLFDEYLGGDSPVFIGPDVHIGTDEYSKKEAESFRKFTDHYLGLVQSYGKRARLWGALTHAKGETKVRSENIIMNAWYNGYADPSDMIDQGYELISTSDRHLYIVPAAGYYYDYLNLDFLYNKWEPNMIGGDIFPFGHPSISGGTFAVWNDHCGNGISEKDVHHRSYPALQVLAHKMWAGKKSDITLDSFKTRATALVESPGVNVMGTVTSIDSTVLDYDFRSAKGIDQSKNSYDLEQLNRKSWSKRYGFNISNGSTITTPIEEIGYPYKVDFDITFSSELSSETTLFSSNSANVVVSKKNGLIELGFKRDGYHYSFAHKFNSGSSLSISIKGDNKGTTLLINGIEVERLEGTVEEHKNEKGKIDKLHIQQTLVFPLSTIGDKESESLGTIHSLRVTKL